MTYRGDTRTGLRQRQSHILALAVLLAAGTTITAFAGPDICTVSGSVATCQGDQSDGITNLGTVPDFASPPVDTLIVNNLTGQIQSSKLFNGAAIEFFREDGGGVSITTTAEIFTTGPLTGGIFARASNTSQDVVIINEGNISTSAFAGNNILASQSGSGSVFVSSTGDIDSSRGNSVGIGIVEIGPGNVTLLNTGNIVTGRNGIDVRANQDRGSVGDGNISIDSRGDITASNNSDGIFVLNEAGSGTISLNVEGDILTEGSFSDAIFVSNIDGIHDISINYTGAIGGPRAVSGQTVSVPGGGGIFARQTGSGDVIIATIADIEAGNEALGVDESGTGSVSIDHTGQINLQGSRDGIRVSEAGFGDASVTVAGSIESFQPRASGISVAERDDGSITIDNSSDIFTSGDEALGISVAQSGAGSVTVTSSGPVETRGDEAFAIAAANISGGDVTVTSSGPVVTAGELSIGIVAVNLIDDDSTTAVVGGTSGSVVGGATSPGTAIGSSNGTSSAEPTPSRAAPDGAGIVGVIARDTVSTSGPSSAAILATNLAGGDITINVLGALTTTGTQSAGILAISTVPGSTALKGRTMIEIQASVAATGEDSSGLVVVSGAGQSSETHIGATILQGGSGNAAGIDFSGSAPGVDLTSSPEDSTHRVVNNGTVSALSGVAIRGGEGIESIDNLGTLDGAIQLFGGDDVLNLFGAGTFSGNADFGGGDDRLFLEGNFDVANGFAGGSGVDTIETDAIGQSRIDLTSVTGFETLTASGQGTLTVEGSPTNNDLQSLQVRQGMTNLLTPLPTLNVETSAGAVFTSNTEIGSLANVGTLGIGQQMSGDIATLTVNGDVVFTPPGTLVVDLAENGTADLLAIDGMATITGTLSVNGLGDPGSGTATIVTANGGVIGSFDNVVDNLPDVDISASYAANNVDLVYTISTDTSDKSIAPNSLQAASNAARLFAETLQSRATLGSIPGGTDATLSDESASGLSSAVSTNGVAAPVYSAWAGVFGSRVDVDNTATATGYDSDTLGFVIGGEGLFETDGGAFVRSGFAFGHSQSDIDSGLSSADADIWHIGLYGSVEHGPLIASGAISYGFSDYDFTRIIPVAGAAPAVARGESDGGMLATSLAASYDIAPMLGLNRNGLRFAPVVRLDYLHGDLDGYAENGAGILNQNFADTDWSRAIAGVGFQLSAAYETASGAIVKPDLEIRYDRAFGDDRATASSAIAALGTGSFSSTGASESENSIIIGTGLTVDFDEKFSGHIRYDGTFSNNHNSHRASAGVTLKF